MLDENFDCFHFLCPVAWKSVTCRVARLFLTQYTKTGKNVPNEHKMSRMVINIPHFCKIFQMAEKYFNVFQSRTLQILPKFGFLVWKETIWQPWSRENRETPKTVSFRCLIPTNKFRSQFSVQFFRGRLCGNFHLTYYVGKNCNFPRN
jgi:hypothetical protein